MRNFRHAAYDLRIALIWSLAPVFDVINVKLCYLLQCLLSHNTVKLLSRTADVRGTKTQISQLGMASFC